MIFLGACILLLAAGFSRWAYDKWRLSMAVKRCFVISLLCFLAFEVSTVFVPPYSFFGELREALHVTHNALALAGISVCLLSVNMLFVTQIVFLLSPTTRVDFREFLRQQSANNPKLAEFLKTYAVPGTPRSFPYRALQV